jgi:hypothetical protein
LNGKVLFDSGAILLVKRFEPLNTHLIYFWIDKIAKVFTFPPESNLNKDKTAQHTVLCIVRWRFLGNLCPFVDLFRTTFPIPEVNKSYTSQRSWKNREVKSHPMILSSVLTINLSAKICKRMEQERREETTREIRREADLFHQYYSLLFEPVLI